jgi:DNA repair protein RadC
MANLPLEVFWLLLLNKVNRVIKKVRTSQGGISGTVVDPKKVIKTGLDN